METCLEPLQVNVKKLWIKYKGQKQQKLSTTYYRRPKYKLVVTNRYYFN